MTMREHLSLTILGNRDGTWRLIAIVVFCALCWAWPVATVFDFVINRQPPVSYIEAYAPHPDVAAGGQVEIRFDVNRARICPVINVSRFIVDATDLEHAVLGFTRAPQTRPGREVYDRVITVPDTVPPGKASYLIRIQYGCNWLNYLGWPITVESPRVPLTVWPRASQDLGFLPLTPLRQLPNGDGPGE